MAAITFAIQSLNICFFLFFSQPVYASSKIFKKFLFKNLHRFSLPLTFQMNNKKKIVFLKKTYLKIAG